MVINIILQLFCIFKVIGRTMRQIKQIRKGLKETEVFQLLTGRADVVPMMFPRHSATVCSAKVTLNVEY